ncbi:MAG: exodeoxyribonuclease VII large subunit [Anaerolineae bacterium]|jgi:exodeoxyribonuclease VII large subunit|nr:exodeoxyribonuclease VII large subunit [Anaerolineae bacterium]
MTDIYSITGITAYLRTLLENNELLQDVWVKGEISNMTRATSGHWYFTVKDSGAQLKGVMFKAAVQRQSFEPQNGDSVHLHGRLSVYEARGEYQLYADEIQRAGGVGDLYAQFEALKQRLAAEGLFDDSRKRPLPARPRCLGVVTSPDAAAFQDVRRVLAQRFPLALVLLSPTPVQGAEAPAQIVRAIERLNHHGQADVLLVCRGGGSIEDLWSFNDERVARAIAASRIPVISGVGHETDFTIADFVADVRAPTPSAAAMLATPDRADLETALRGLDDALTWHLDTHLSAARADLNGLRQSLRYHSPARQVNTARQRLDDLEARARQSLAHRLALHRERLHARSAALHAASPAAILARGYAIITRSDDGQPVTSARGLKPGTGITLRLRDGEAPARIEDKDSHERYKRTLF